MRATIVSMFIFTRHVSWCQKLNASVRVTHDYSGLKRFTSSHQFEQVKIEDVWTCESKTFSEKLDFIKAFHAVEIAKEDRKFYGFLGPEGEPYYYKVLPMSTRNSPAHFNEILQRSLKELSTKYRQNIRTYQINTAIGPEETTRQ
eukprot:GHVP01031884.1.p1 GENE.GHVP01031884.1~~GHVP01031884.1.p1  ORF type:complete len:145 (+),score=12.63 GHVP01031884.1:211-645(+)